MKARIEGTAKLKRKAKKSSQNLKRQISENEAKFIQNEFQKDVLERDWTKVYEILSHLKNLSSSLVIHEMRVGT